MLDTFIPPVSSMIISASFFCFLLGLSAVQGDSSFTIDQSNTDTSQLLYSPQECWKTNDPVTLDDTSNVLVARDECDGSPPNMTLVVNGKQ